jgi:Tol biopolymer transport system component
MRRLVRPVALVATLVVTGSPALAQRGGRGGAEGGASAGLPLKPATALKFTTDEGTWLSLDLSPDGRTIVFELLGDIYTLPIEGGRATRITSGQPFDAQPHYSPDGTSIVFVSDRSQSDNLWIMNADGTNPRALTRENDQKFQSPTFTPDGKYVVASKGNDIFMYYANGGTTAGMRVTGDSAAGGRGGAAPGGGRGGGAPNVFLGAAPSKDGRYIYFAMRNSTGGGYNQTALGWQIGVLDRETGKTFTKTNAVGSGMRPELSPDGRWLAYATRNNAETSLILRDLSNGDERLLLPSIQRDDQESRPNRDVVPTYAFTPDSRSIVIGHHGHFWRANVADGRETMIPFTADVDLMIAGPQKESYAMNDSVLTVHQIRDIAPSPDNRRMVFVALDRLWIMDLPSGTPHRLVPTENVGEFQPTWSPDGQYIAYVTWNDLDGGAVSRVRAAGGTPERLSGKPAYYEKPAYSLDGRRIVVGRGPRNMRKDREELERPPAQAVGVELVWLPGDGGPETLIAPISNFGRPHFVNGDTVRVYFSEGTSLVSMRWDGTDQKTILRTGGGGGRGGGGGGGGGGEMTMAPDGSKVLLQVADQAGPRVYVIHEIPQTGTAPAINVANLAQSQVPVRKATGVGGEFAHWSGNGSEVYFALGHSLFTYDVAAADAAMRDSVTRAQATRDTAGGANPAGGRGGGRGAAPARPIYEAARRDIVITVPKDKPQGTVVLRGARLLTMKGSEVIPKGEIVVKDNRIVAVGAQGKVSIPNGAKIIDVSGKTIMPGYVDIHAHIWPAFGIHRSQPFEYLVNLAYGVTTTRDPQTSTTDVLSYEDMVETGDFVGPRIFSTGPGVFQQTQIKTIDEARQVLRKYSEFYGTETIKQYMAGDRRTRQLIIMAAREQHLSPTLEGGLDFKKNLTEAMDGYAGSEHTLPIAPLYKDVLTLYANSGTTWTPTLIVQYGGPWAENYWYEHSDVIDDPKLNHFTPRDVVERKALRRPGWWAPSQWSFQLFAQQAAKVVAAGGHVGMGSHGQLQGLGAQWEVWNIASGGMPRYDVLRVATIFGAEAIGHEKDVGSLEAGKFADLQVLDKNPLDDIKNTNTIKYVMKNGRLYDGNTLDEVWPRQKQIARLWWWNEPVQAGQQKGQRP